MKKIALALMMAFTGYLANAQSVTLKLNPDNGSKYDIVAENVSAISQEIMGQTMKIDAATLMDMEYDFKNEGADKLLSITYGDTKADIAIMGQTMNLDSNSPDTSNDGNNVLRSIKGSKISALVGTDGSVKKVMGAEALVEKTKGGDPVSGQMLSELFSPENMKSLFEQNYKFYPTKAVKPGDSWSSTLELEKPYKMTSKSTYTLQKVEGGKSYIALKGSMGTDAPIKVEQQGMQIELSIEGPITGTLVVDNKTGITESSVLKQDMKGTASAMGQTIPMIIESTLTMKAKKK